MTDPETDTGEVQVEQADSSVTAAAAPESEAVPVAPEGDDAAPPAEGGRSAAALPWIIAAVAFLIAVVAAVLGITSYTAAKSLRDEAASRTAAKEAGEVVALQITTLDGAKIDEWVNRTRSLATGQFREDLARGYDEELRAEFRESKVQTVGEVIQSFVQNVEGDRAVVFVILRQTTARPGSQDVIEDELRMEVTLQRAENRWLASDVAVLTPTPPLSGAAPAAGQDQPPASEDPAGGQD